MPYPVGNKTRAVDRTIALASEDVAYDVLYGWEKHWTNRIADHAKQYKHISVAYLASSSVEDTIEDASESQFPYLVLGYALVIALRYSNCQMIHGIGFYSAKTSSVASCRSKFKKILYMPTTRLSIFQACGIPLRLSIM